MRELSSITEAEANALGKAIEDEAKVDGGKPVSYAIIDVCGDPILAYRMDGASADTFWIALNKARSALRAGKDTVEIAHQRKAVRHAGTSPGNVATHGPDWTWERRSAHEHRFDDNRRTASPTFVSWAGGVRLMLNGEAVGALAVSGRDELEDHTLASDVYSSWVVRHHDRFDSA